MVQSAHKYCMTTEPQLSVLCFYHGSHAHATAHAVGFACKFSLAGSVSQGTPSHVKENYDFRLTAKTSTHVAKSRVI